MGSVTDSEQPREPTPKAPRSKRDLLAAVASGVVGALALATSTYNVYLQRQQVRAQVWPHLVWSPSLDEGRFSATLENRGVGPADVRRVRVMVDGKATTDWVDATSLLLRKKSFAFPNISWIESQVMSPGQSITAIAIHDQDEARQWMAERRRLTVEICYCSTLGDCWVMSAPGSGGNTTQPAADCAPDARPFTSVEDRVLDDLLAKLRADAAVDGSTREHGADAGAVAHAPGADTPEQAR
jgi:hypothetical protein